MIAAGKFASLPRNMQMSHEFSLASSMDLLTSKPSRAADHRSGVCQDVSIHGTLPRKKRGTIPVGSSESRNHMGTLPCYKAFRPQGPLIQDIIEEYPQKNKKNDNFFSRDQNAVDPAMEYVKEMHSARCADAVSQGCDRRLEEEQKLSTNLLFSVSHVLNILLHVPSLEQDLLV